MYLSQHPSVCPAAIRDYFRPVTLFTIILTLTIDSTSSSSSSSSDEQPHRWREDKYSSPSWKDDKQTNNMNQIPSSRQSKYHVLIRQRKVPGKTLKSSKHINPRSNVAWTKLRCLYKCLGEQSLPNWGQLPWLLVYQDSLPLDETAWQFLYRSSPLIIYDIMELKFLWFQLSSCFQSTWLQSHRRK